MPVEVIGADVVAREFEKLSNISYADFINVISKQAIFLLKANTPVDTGELRSSWREIYRTDRTVAIGTDSSQIVKLRSLVLGTKYIQANDFITPVAQVLFNNIESIMIAHLKKSHPYLSNMKGGHIRVPTTSNIAGDTGFTVSKNRAFGRQNLSSPTGLKGYNPRTGLRRKLASFRPYK